MDTAVQSPQSLARDTGLHRRLGEILLTDGVLTQHDIGSVLTAQRRSGERFGAAAMKLKLLTRTQLHGALARQFQYPIVSDENSPLSQQLVAARDPGCTCAEMLRTLRSELLLRWFGEHGSALTVVAARAEEACDVLSANLAITFAQLGERTLLADMNLRRPSQHQLFGVHAKHGVTDLLGGRASFQTSGIPQPLPNLFLLDAGVMAPNPQELLSRLHLTQLLAELSATFDVVIVNTPPLLEFADAQIIAARTGGSLLVTKRHVTRHSDVGHVRGRLQTCGATLVGAVIHD